MDGTPTPLGEECDTVFREQGDAMTTGLPEVGVRTIAVHVYGDDGSVTVGLGIVADANRTSAAQLAGEHLIKLRAAADRSTELATR